MRRVLIACLLVGGLSVPLATPSYAIFGSSKCKKVKSQVMKNYVREVSLLSEYHKTFGYPAPEIGIQARSPQPEAIRMKILKKTADFEYKNFNYVMNNYYCFTKSQHQYAIRMYDYWNMIKSYTDYGLDYLKVLDRTRGVSTYSVLDY